MKMVMFMIILLFISVAGCATDRYSPSSYQDRAALEAAIANDPDYYRMWSEEAGR
ncbi:MAG: hypothetical protein ACOZFS_14605 [Thermodesulfobacteriota bacterium]